jgi:hypothetical protein
VARGSNTESPSACDSGFKATGVVPVPRSPKRELRECDPRSKYGESLSLRFGLQSNRSCTRAQKPEARAAGMWPEDQIRRAPQLAIRASRHGRSSVDAKPHTVKSCGQSRRTLFVWSVRSAEHRRHVRVRRLAENHGLDADTSVARDQDRGNGESSPADHGHAPRSPRC